MLRIYDKDNKKIDKCSIVRDCELEFERITGIPENESIKNIIKFIDNGEYLDDNSFLDRFGNKLYDSCLSTGCKTAIVVECNPDKFIDTIECGTNALEAIIRFCKSGNIIVHNFNQISGFGYGEEKISIEYNGKKYTNIGDLSRDMG